MYKQIGKIALKGIAMAMGIAVIFMSTLETLELSTVWRCWTWCWPRWPSPACRNNDTP